MALALDLDRAPCPLQHLLPGESFDLFAEILRALSGSHVTRRWREMDSNPRSLSEGEVLEVEQNRLDERVLLHGGPRVRIRLPPAESLCNPTRSSTPRVETPPIQASWITAIGGARSGAASTACCSTRCCTAS